jgi:hypothetical protein
MATSIGREQLSSSIEQASQGRRQKVRSAAGSVFHVETVIDEVTRRRVGLGDMPAVDRIEQQDRNEGKTGDSFGFETSDKEVLARVGARGEDWHGDVPMQRL